MQTRFSLSGLRDMQVNPWTLAFPPHQEALFCDYYYKSSLILVRFFLGLAVLFFALFGFLDAILVPDMKAVLWGIRFGFICGGVLLLLLLTFTRRFADYMQPALAIGMTWAGFGIILMIVIAKPPVSYSYYAGLILVLMYGYTFLRIRFVYASISGWMIVLLYEVAALFFAATPRATFINNNFFFICANVVGMCASYTIEYYARRHFYMAERLVQEQEKVRAINTELEKRVEERTRQLLDANRDLEQEIAERKRTEKVLLQAQKMEAIGTLAGGIAHDFNNILSAILGYCEIALRKRPQDEARLQHCLRQIMHAGTRARELIGQILTFSRKQEQSRSALQLGAVTRDVMGLVSATLPKTIGIQIRANAQEDVVLANQTQVHQIIMNLCANAAYAMKDSGGTLTVSVVDGARVDYPAAFGDEMDPLDYIAVCVRDTGTGIPADVVERIFDPFFSTKAMGEGTGMGLSVVHGLMQSFGGHIAVDTEEGRGTCFYLLFPRHVPQPESDAPTPGQAPSGTERILVVDDEQDLVEVGSALLEEMGYRVVGCTDPREALDAFTADPDGFDLIITDKSMPHMSGFELTQRLRDCRADIPILLCSGYSDEQDVRRARQLGIEEIVMKPLVMRELGLVVRGVLDQVITVRSGETQT